MNIRYWLGFALSTSALGCGTFLETTALNAPPRPLTPRPAETVEVYSSTLPLRPHQDVAIIRAQSDNYGLARALEDARKRAGEMGCDAIFITSVSQHPNAPPDAPLALLAGNANLLYATCIVWLAPSGAEVPALAAASPAAVVAAPAPNATGASALAKPTEF